MAENEIRIKDLPLAQQIEEDDDVIVLDNATDGTRKLQGKVLLDMIHSAMAKGTASGAVASFTDGADGIPMTDLVVSIEPQQSGSGEPSPENVRPISGWDECNVSDGGTNVFNPQGIDFGTYTDSTNSWYAESVPNYQKAFETTFKANTQYHFSGIATQGVSGKNLRLQVVYTDTTVDNIWGSNSTEPLNINFTSASGKTIDFLRFTYGNSGGNVTIKDFQIEIGTSASTYTKFTGLNTYTINFVDGSSPLTVYGGTLDVLSGVLTVTNGFIASYNGETLPSTWISDRDVYAEGTTPTTGAEVCYKLATPQTYQLTPTQVKSLLGVNNIWADTGNILNAEYVRDTTTIINQILARLDALES